ATDEAKGDPLGVLALNLDLKGQTRVEGDRERFAVLVDTRPNAAGKRGLILRHPYLEQYKDAATGLPPLQYADSVVRWFDSRTPDFEEERDYEDPVGGEFAGPWL